jgi:hypothetical protein
VGFVHKLKTAKLHFVFFLNKLVNVFLASCKLGNLKLILDYPTIVSYNTSAAIIFTAMSGLVDFENNNVFFFLLSKAQPKNARISPTPCPKFGNKCKNSRE